MKKSGTLRGRLSPDNSVINITAGANDMVFNANSSERRRITSTGDVGIGTTTPAARLDVVDATTTTSAIIVPRAGNFTGATVNGMVRYNTASTLFEFYQNGSWVNYTTISDGRLKTNIVPVTEGLKIVNQLNPVFYDQDRSNPKASGFEDKHQVGFVAQDVEKGHDEMIQSLDRDVASFDSKTSKLESENAELKARLTRIELESAAQQRELAAIKRKQGL